jgi:integrase
MNPNHARSQTRTASTIKVYLKRADSILSRIADEMQMPEDAYPAPDDVVAYMQHHASGWKWATFRQYQASLVCRYQIEFERTQDPLFEETANRIRALPWADCKKPTEPGQTSSRKRKGVPKRDYDVLVANLSNPKQGSDYARRAALWLMAALATGLRPCEWQGASLSDDGILTAKNAKATNGRGTGVNRFIPVPPDDTPVVRTHIESLNEMQSKGFTFAQIHNRCGEALRRACQSLWGKDPKRRYALYSARHQFAANAKATKSQEEVAELLGHRSVRTAQRHYAKRRSAWAQFRNAQVVSATPQMPKALPQPSD